MINFIIQNILILTLLISCISAKKGTLESTTTNALRLQNYTSMSIVEGGSLAIDFGHNGKDFLDSSAITYSCHYDKVVDGNVSSSANLCSGLNGASFNNTTGVFLWTPGYSDSGNYEIFIQARKK